MRRPPRRRRARFSSGGRRENEPLKPIIVERPDSQEFVRRPHAALLRCLRDIEVRGEVGAPFDRASALLAALVPALAEGDADAARACILECDLPSREALDLVLRARTAVRRRRGRRVERAERERAADAALRALADREDPSRPEDLERRRQIATQHRRLLGLLTDGLLTTRTDGRVIHANGAALDILGLRLSDLKDLEISSCFVEPRLGAAVRREAMEEGVVRGREADLRGRNGSTIPVRVSAARVDGPDPRLLVHFRDLTEIRHIRSRLLETEKLGAMAKIAGSVAHEIRNPLNALFLNADLLEDELREAQGMSESIGEILGVMREEIERLNEIIKNYLSLSKLANANFEILDLNQIVAEFFEEIEESASRRGVKLEFRPSRREAIVRADRNMMRRVLVNLVQNALDAAPKGGRVVVGTRRLVHKAKLWVRDTGPGIADDVQTQIFQPFFSTKERGTGLGLYLIREIVIAHDGQVALTPAEPHGTVATILLPLLASKKGDGA
ncbi:MAG: two-component system sensor histidine kinase NtrB [Planctomycetaceae bacterium]